jgi:RNA polymerase sigma factor (sigma-70 family)
MSVRCDQPGEAMDRAALERALEELHAQSFAWARVCCGRSRADAEDVLQNAYLKVLEGSARYEGRASFRTFLFGVIRYTAAHERRRMWLRGWTNGNGSHAHADPRPRADAAVENGERNEQLRAALRTLPRRQLEVLELVFYHDMTIEEAGTVMQVSLGTARTHYERGKKNLLRRLQDDS